VRSDARGRSLSAVATGGPGPQGAAGDASPNFNAVFIVQELSFDTSPSILELASKQIISALSRVPGTNQECGRRDRVCAMLVFLYLLKGHTKGVT